MEVNEYEQFSNLKIGVPCIVFLRSDFFSITKKLANSNDRGYIIRNMNINITADLSYDSKKFIIKELTVFCLQQPLKFMHIPLISKCMDA